MNKSNLTKEDIQAIAEELAKHQCASTRAPSKTNGKNKNEGGKSSPSRDYKNLGFVGLFLVWAMVFVVLAIKLAPYI